MTSGLFVFRAWFQRFLQFLYASCAILLAASPSYAFNQRDFSDSFEAKAFLDLFQRDRSRWTHYQSTFPENRGDLASDRQQSGETALKLFAVASTSVVSKAAIEKEAFDMRSGQSFQVSAWFFIPPELDLSNLFLIDIECRTCWPKNSIFLDKNPGIRLKLRDRDGTPVVERRKIGLPDMRNLLQVDGALPRGRWFKLAWLVTLDAGGAGTAEIRIDDRLTFRSEGATFPNPEAFKKWGIELRDVLYDRFQIGITANSSPNPIELYLDTVSFKSDWCSPDDGKKDCPRAD